MKNSISFSFIFNRKVFMNFRSRKKKDYQCVRFFLSFKSLLCRSDILFAEQWIILWISMMDALSFVFLSSCYRKKKKKNLQKAPYQCLATELLFVVYSSVYINLRYGVIIIIIIIATLIIPTSPWWNHQHLFI